MQPTKQSQTFDNSRLSDYKTCPRSYYLRHVRGWRRNGSSLALSFGQAWHSALEAVWNNANTSRATQVDAGFSAFNQTWIEEGLNPDLSLEEQELISPHTPGIAHEMLHNYTTVRQSLIANSELLGNEQPFAVPMPELPDVFYIGKMDKVIKTERENVVLEHKTTSLYSIKYGFQPDYVESWNSSSQVKGYEFGAALFFPNISGVWVDAALVHKKIHDQFKLIPIQHSLPLLKEWLINTRGWIARVQSDLQTLSETGNLTDRPTFIKNEDSCFGKYGSCPFLDICRSYADVSSLDEPPQGFIEDRWEPFDVLNIEQLSTTGDKK